MKKRVILEGNEKAVEAIIKENRIRVGRGDVKFTETPVREKAIPDPEDDSEGSRVRGRRPKQEES